MKKTILGIMVVALISILAISSVLAVSYGNRNSANPIMDKDALENAIESGDFATWKSLHTNSNGKMVSLINESNFYLLKEMHDAKESGDYNKVQEIKTRLGFISGSSHSDGKGKLKNQNSNHNNCPYSN